MAKKDIAEKILESYNNALSDIVNVLLFHGKPLIRPGDLTDQAPRAAYKTDGKIREIVPDMKINPLEIAYLTRKQVNLF